MSKFLGDDYLIDNASAASLYPGVSGLPLVDPHNHADVREISENGHYTDIWQAECATDHYVWELLRKRGIAEDYITGNRSNDEKWQSAAAVWDDFAGNPTYEWVHLDLQRRFAIGDLINAGTAADIWHRTGEALQRDEMKPRALLRTMNVEVMCSTDDPIDTLEHHKNLAGVLDHTVVKPTFRPDRAVNIFKKDWRGYIADLETRVNGTFKNIGDVIAALRTTHDHFAEHGCLASDHGVEIPYAYAVDEADADTAFRAAYDRKKLEQHQEIAYMSYIFNEVAAMDCEKDWVLQIHIGAVRDVRTALFDDIGPDAGGDVSSQSIDIVKPLQDLLNRFDDKLKIIFYCVDPTHQPTITTLARAYGAKTNVGPAWWWNDAPHGMARQLEYIAEADLLANFPGMVSDSRKLLSYGSRHEMFRRVLCSVVGRMVEAGRVPMAVAENLVQRIVYDNPKRFFGFG